MGSNFGEQPAIFSPDNQWFWTGTEWQGSPEYGTEPQGTRLPCMYLWGANGCGGCGNSPCPAAHMVRIGWIAAGHLPAAGPWPGPQDDATASPAGFPEVPYRPTISSLLEFNVRLRAAGVTVPVSG